jgi:sulfoxide reductase catalytic subunit YedY
MLIRIPKPWQLPERETTPEPAYRSRVDGASGTLGSRREFLRDAALCLGAVALNSTRGLSSPSSPARGGVLQGLDAPRNTKFQVEGRAITPESITAHVNNYYEFRTDKKRVAELAERFESRPWQIEVRGLVDKPLKFDVDDLIKRFRLEERVYRLRCVEAWSIVVPWVGFPLAKFIEWAKPTAKAKYLRMVSFLRPGQAPGQREMPWYPWPYFEGLRLDEASNELAMLVVGSYGHLLPNQNGSPLRLVTPWKYGYKSIKAITLVEFTQKRPPTFWNTVVPQEYDFLSNVNPAVPHPRWSQASEEDVGRGRRIATLPYNGYGEYVAHLYR